MAFFKRIGMLPALTLGDKIRLLYSSINRIKVVSSVTIRLLLFKTEFSGFVSMQAATNAIDSSIVMDWTNEIEGCCKVWYTRSLSASRPPSKMSGCNVIVSPMDHLFQYVSMVVATSLRPWYFSASHNATVGHCYNHISNSIAVKTTMLFHTPSSCFVSCHAVAPGHLRGVTNTYVVYCGACPNGSVERLL